MPSGKVHDRLTLLTAAASLPLWALLVPEHEPQLYLSGVAAYLFSGFLLSDDLDTASLCYKRWGLLKFIWWPYRTMIPHRSWLSHGFVIGPMFRVLYFCIAATLISKCATLVINRYFMVEDRFGILRHASLSLTAWATHHPAALIAAAIGLILGGFTHSLADGWVSFWKRVW